MVGCRKNASHAARMENRVLMISRYVVRIRLHAFTVIGSIDAMPNAWSFMNIFTHEAN